MSVQISRRGWRHQHTVMLLYTDAQTQSVCHVDVMSAFFFAAEQRHLTHPLKFSLPFFAPPTPVTSCCRHVCKSVSKGSLTHVFTVALHGDKIAHICVS